MSTYSAWLVPIIVCGIPLFGLLRGIPVYAEFVEGAREGLLLAARLLPYLAAIVVAISALRASGAMDWLVGALAGPMGALGLPAEILPLAAIRPISGSGALALTADLMRQHGADSAIGRLACVVQGSTDTTLYIIAVYFGSVGVRRVRHALACGLVADAVAVFASVYLCRWWFG